jgi:DNA-binding NtrC family response regulator
MGSGIRALLVHDEKGPLTELRALLQRQGLETAQAHSCADAAEALSCIQPPDLVFTDTVFKDGTWADIERLAKKAALPVIVVSPFVDLPLYLDVLERGAADFIVPPFRDADIAYVVKGALLSTSRVASGLSGAATRVRSTMTQHAQNHSDSGGGAAHAQAGR